MKQDKQNISFLQYPKFFTNKKHKNLNLSYVSVLLLLVMNVYNFTTSNIDLGKKQHTIYTS